MSRLFIINIYYSYFMAKVDRFWHWEWWLWSNWDMFSKLNQEDVTVNTGASMATEVRRLLWVTALGAMIVLGMSSQVKAQTQDINFMTWCEHTLDMDDQPAIVCDSDREYVYITDELLSLQIAGIPTDDFMMNTDEASRQYYLDLLSDPVILKRTGYLLKQIEDWTGYAFGWQDIPGVIYLVAARYSWDADLWEENYVSFILTYPALREDLTKILSETWFTPGEDV